MSNISLTDGHIDNAEHCVCCGAVIPEGRQVCIICGLKTNYKQSTADVVEVRHGEWVKDRATIKCSCCGFGMYQDGYFLWTASVFLRITINTPQITARIAALKWTERTENNDRV